MSTRESGTRASCRRCCCCIRTTTSSSRGATSPRANVSRSTAKSFDDSGRRRARSQARAPRACGRHARPQVWRAHRLDEDRRRARRARAPAQPAQRLHSVDHARRTRTDTDERAWRRASHFDERISCARTAARASATSSRSPTWSNARTTSRGSSCRSRASDDVHLIGFPGCYPNKYSLEMMKRLCTHPNVGAVLLVSLGCESFNREAAAPTRSPRAAGPVDLLVIQQSGGTTRTLNAGLDIVQEDARRARASSHGADGARTNWSSARSAAARTAPAASPRIPAVGRCFDWLIENDAACIFEETGELIGCERIMASRAITPELGREIEACVDKAANYYRIMGYGSFAPGNAEGGLTTLEEKSMGAYSKSGSSPICGLDQARRHPAARRPLPARRRARRRAALRLPEHLRQRRDRRAHRLRLAPDPVHHRPRLGGGIGHLAGHQGLRESGHLRAHGRRHGRERRPHPARRRARRSRPRDLRSRAERRAAASCRSPKRSATRNSSSPTNNSNRSARPACRPPDLKESILKLVRFGSAGAERPGLVDCGRQHRRSFRRHSRSLQAPRSRPSPWRSCARSTRPNYRAHPPACASAPASAASASSSRSASTTPTTRPRPARRFRANPSCS